MFLAPEEFRQIFTLRDESKKISPDVLDAFNKLQEASKKNSDRLSMLAGKYYCYRPAVKEARKYSRAVVSIYQKDGLTHFDRVEYLCDVDEKFKTYYSCKFNGLMFLTADRIFTYEMRSNDSLNVTTSLSIFYLSTLGKRLRLYGGYLGVGNKHEQSINRSKIVLERIGEGSILKSDLAKCGYIRETEQVAYGDPVDHLFESVA
ncbi:hypothetical protein AIOL_003470 [Candidatus Rhodobacter oscarellae]|uniref:Uncharacterized protein n=2 Tax=Candidatus Rhodobacter oscarellae TaxID=1675527 RepID=A0A0J9E6U7_9RHOB|nr:hypothetical protein AIOL_003470 [Candidatus Rhodobacter lobularis]